MLDEPIRQSILGWLISALGIRYAVLLPLAGLICFLFTLILVLRGKGPLTVAGLVLVVHVPLLIGIFGALDGIIGMLNVISMSSTTPNSSEIAEGMSMALVAPIVGMVLMVPSYGTAVFGAMVRSLAAEGAQKSPNS